MVQVAGREISSHSPVFIIAEMSGNHNQCLERALEMVKAAADAGAHALKLQTYTPDTMTLDIHEGEFFISDDKSLWKGRSLFDLYQEAHTPWQWHKPIFDRARALGLIVFSTPFDDTAVEFLETLDVPCYKIASFENTDIALIRKVAQTRKPMFISTGMATLSELDETVQTARENGCDQIVLMKCTSTYPATPENSNLRTLSHMRELFGCEVGISDHTPGIGVAVAAVAQGASVIEKHFTLSRSDGGIDAAFSLEPEELSHLVVETERARQALGRIQYGPVGDETLSRQHRRSLYITRDVKAGDRLTQENVRSIRPGLGLKPRYLDVVLGKKITKNVKRGTPLSWDLVG